MQLYSTQNKQAFVSLKEAIFKGLPDDKGLFMPDRLSPLPESFISGLKQYSFQEIGFEICRHLFRGAIPEQDLKELIEQALTFPAPLVKLDDQKYILELFHGPSLAFKDFGARFMARLMSYFNRHESRELTILVATSGDTGGAVAAGFHRTPGIRVVILYPSGKVSPLQEKQLTTLGDNIQALEIEGTFDDCQAIVKKAFLDADLTHSFRLSSANSINIARLIPQSFYYFEAYKQLPVDHPPVVFCIPSGNFGNLTAGIMSKRMGLPIYQFIAATNKNDAVPQYLASGHFKPHPSIQTLSNAMDVGNPSNFERMLDLYSSTWNNFKTEITGYSISDEETRNTIVEIYNKHSYILDPHGAVGYTALSRFQETHPVTAGILLETAHPAKFLEDMEEILGMEVDIPERLKSLKNQKKVSVKLDNHYQSFKNWLIKQA